MSTAPKPAPRPMVVKTTIFEIGLPILCLWLWRTVADNFGFSRPLSILIGIAVAALLAVGAAARRRKLPELHFIVPVYLLIAAVLGLLYAVTWAWDDGGKLPYVVLMYFVVIGLGYLVLPLLRVLNPHRPDTKGRPMEPSAEDLL